MPTIATILDDVQRVLNDAPTLGANGAVWSRQELLDWCNDGYRALLVEAQSTRRWTVLPIPPRYTYTLTQGWEARFTGGGTWWQWTHQALGATVSSLFEVDILEGATTVAASEGISQQWERSFLNPAQVPFRFGLPRDHTRIVGLWWNHQRLAPVSTRVLDSTEQQWLSLAGQPLCWTLGTGRNRTIEVYEIVTAYTADYSTDSLVGVPRQMSGARTYTASFPGQTAPYGVLRSVSSPDRQYLATTEQDLGTVRQWAGSANNLLCLEVIGPQIGAIEETDMPDLVPQQLHKYLRYYVLYRAFNREGEGYMPALAGFYLERSKRGVDVMQALSQLSRRDHQWTRQPETVRIRPGRTRLPSTYPNVWR